MISKTQALLSIYNRQRQTGQNDDLVQDLKRGVEDEVAKEDHRAFFGGDPEGEHLRAQLGKMLKDKPLERFDKSREGAKGARG